MKTPSASDLARLRDLAEAYRDAMHLDNVIEESSPLRTSKESDVVITRAAHRFAKAAAEILLPDYLKSLPRRNP